MFWKRCRGRVVCFIKKYDGICYIYQTYFKEKIYFLSLLPNIVFGWIPLLIWAFMPYNAVVSNILLPFSIICITFGVGDYLNVWNAMRQMPKNSMQALSGFNSYWYIEN
ncbi:MAG: metalloprotease family protein [Terrisporobacter othiniensis]|nr:metalloprotease family protein [Terrisporobacter othiniensis]MDU6986168.1 metalloprotease family protein [Terrisporobacter othiniensis]